MLPVACGQHLGECGQCAVRHIFEQCCVVWSLWKWSQISVTVPRIDCEDVESAAAAVSRVTDKGGEPVLEP